LRLAVGEPGAKRRTVVQRLHAEHTVHIGRPLWTDGYRAGGVHETVEAQPGLGPAVERPRDDLAAVQVESGDLVAQPDVDRVLLAERARIPGDRPIGAVDQVADPVGDAARRVRREVATLERHDLQLVRAAPAARLRGGGHAGGVAPDDDKSFGHGPILTGCRRRGAHTEEGPAGPGPAAAASAALPAAPALGKIEWCGVHVP